MLIGVVEVNQVILMNEELLNQLTNFQLPVLKNPTGACRCGVWRLNICTG